MQREQHDHGIEGFVVVAGEIRVLGRNSRRTGSCDRGRGVRGIREHAGQGTVAAPGIQDTGRRRQDICQPCEVSA